MIVNRYDSDKSENVNEAGGRYFGYPYGSGEYDSTEAGSSTNKGKLWKAATSFAICAAVSWPLTALMGIGALHSRIMRKWDDKNKGLQALDPRYWIDYVVNKDIGITRDKNGKPTKEALNKFQSAVAATAGGAAAAAAAKFVTDASMSTMERKRATDAFAQTVKNKECKPYWATLTNGEVVRVHAPDKKSATDIVDLLLNSIAATYIEHDKNIKKGAALYTVYFDDGEIALQSGRKISNRKKDMNEAVKAAVKSRTEFTDQMNKQLKSANAIQTTPLAAPKVVNVVRKTPKAMPVPKAGVYKIESVRPREAEKKAVTLPKDPYRMGDLTHYLVKYNAIEMNVPAKTDAIAYDMFRTTLSNSKFAEAVVNRGETGCFKIEMNDGDVYPVFADTLDDAITIARDLMAKKQNTIKSILKGDELDDYNGGFAEYDRQDGSNALTDMKKYTDEPMKTAPSMKGRSVVICIKDENGKSRVVRSMQIGGNSQKT